MVDVQPGKVATYDPSVTLTNYSDSGRTRFLHNGTQFVKAKLISSRATFAHVGYVSGGNDVTGYTNYVDSNGDYVLVDGSKYIPEATGGPSPGFGNYIIVSYPLQVSTSEIIFWTISQLSFYSDFVVKYSYDGTTYFSATVSTVVETYDNDIARRVGDVPPSGEYVYTLTLGSTYTARYFKVIAYDGAARPSYAEFVTEIAIVPIQDPILEIWDTDGSQA
ncbi:hypothetical protein LCGC14_2742560, partial [marine sediment metagenome]